MKSWEKQFLFVIWTLVLMLAYQQVSAYDGTCGTNVAYTFDGNAILFSRVDPDSAAEWQDNCKNVFKSNPNITVLKVTDTIPYYSGMFSGCGYIREMYLSKLDVSGMTDMSGMFSGYSQLKKLDLSGWDTSKVTNMGSMFKNCGALQSLNLSGWNTSNVTNMNSMFYYCGSLQSLDLSGWNTSKVEDMGSMFEMYYDFNGWENYLTSLQSLDLSGWDISNVKNMESMFANCINLTSLNMSDWDPSNVTNMGSMFNNCRSLTSLDVSGWDISNVTNMGSMFRNCSSLQSLDLSDWNTTKVTDMGSMFEMHYYDDEYYDSYDGSYYVEEFYETSLQSLNLSGWNTSNVTNMSSMFRNCRSLTNFDLSGWDTSNVADMDYMFYCCDGLQTLTLGKNTLKQNIFVALPSYNNAWTYIAQGEDASQPLPLMTTMENASLFTAYDPVAMAGTWSVRRVWIQDPVGTDITGQTITVNNPVYQIKATITPDMLPQNFTLSSNDQSIATVDQTGKVSFLKEGTVTITATATSLDNESVWVKLTYKKPLVSAVMIKDLSGTNITGGTITTNDAAYQLNATAEPAGAAQEFTWSSSNTGTASVDTNGNVNFTKAGTVTVKATAADGSGKSASVTLTYVPLAASVSIKNTSGMVITGQTITTNITAYQLRAIAEPAGAAQNFTWTSNDTGTAVVDTNGKVSFSKTGTVTITAAATDGSGKSASVTLTYVPLSAAVSIKDASGTDITGQTITINITAYQLKAAAAPSDAAQNFSWSSSDTGTAAVDTNGKVSFMKTGTVRITAAATDGSGKTASVTLSYVPLATMVSIQDPSGADITGETVTINITTYQLRGAAAPSGASQNFTWSSSDTGTAAVDTNGKVTFMKAGTVTITAAAADGSGEFASVTLSYIPPAARMTIQDLNGNDITGKTVTINTTTYQLRVAAESPAASQQVTWTSSDTGIAAVDASGKVTFRKAGTVMITASAADGSGASAAVMLMTDIKAAKIVIKNSQGTNITGKKTTVTKKTWQLKVTVEPEAYASQNVTWRSSDTRTATVDASGKVTFKKAGKVMIAVTATDGSGVTNWVELKTDIKAKRVTIRNAYGKAVSHKTLKIKTKTVAVRAVAVPAKYAAQKFTWKTSDKKIATVKAGKVTFKKAGTVKITATAKDGSKKSNWIKITYKPSTGKAAGPEIIEVPIAEPRTIWVEPYQETGSGSYDAPVPGFGK